MSGSFYSLNAQYNTLLAVLEDLSQDKDAQDLENVLGVGNNAGNLSMTNVNEITCNTLNYTTLNPSVPEVIGNISQVLAVGNDATNQSITNCGSFEMKLGGGGSITFADGSVQSIAYTGQSGGDQNIQQVLAEGSNAGGLSITNLFNVIAGSATYFSKIEQGRILVKNEQYFGGNSQSLNMNLVAGRPTIQMTQYANATSALQYYLNFDWTGLIVANSSAPNTPFLIRCTNAGLQLDAGTKGVEIVGGSVTNLNQITSNPSQPILLNAGSNKTYSFNTNGTIGFPDGSYQSTAYIQGGGDQNINQVLTEGSDAGGLQISNILGLSTGSVATNPNNALSLLSYNTNNINLTAFPTATASSGAVVVSTQELGGQQNTWYFTNNGDFDLPQGCSINYPSGSGLDEYVGQIDLTAVGADLNLNATGAGGIYLNSATTTLSGTLTFPDNSVQSSAYTGVPNLSAVLTAGSNASGGDISNLGTLGIGSGTIFNSQTNQTITIQKYNAPFEDRIALDNTGSLPLLYIGRYTKTSPSIPNSSILTGIILGENTITGTDVIGNLPLSISSVKGVQLTANTNNWTFNPNGTIVFPNGSIQSSAYVGGGAENLTSVLTTGNNAGNLQITNLAGVAGTTYFIGDAGSNTLLSNGSGGNFNFYCGDGGGLTQLSLQVSQANVTCSAPLSLNGGFAQNVGGIVSSSSNVQYTDLIENTSGSVGYSILGCGMGNIQNYSTALGNGVCYSGTLGQLSVGIGYQAGAWGIGVNSVAIGSNSGSNQAALVQNSQGQLSVAVGFQAGASSASGGGGQGQYAVAIGAQSGSGLGSNGSGMGNGACAIGYQAGSYGMAANSIAIGYQAGRGTSASYAQGQNSIALGQQAGLGFGTTGVPANSFVVSSVRPLTAPNATLPLFYNATTDEIQYGSAGSGGDVVEASVTISPTTDLNNLTTGFISNAYGSNSALPVSVYCIGAQVGQVVRQNICSVYFGSNAFISNAFSDAEMRYTNKINCSNGYINAWELNTFSVNPYRLYNYGQNNGAINTSFAVGNNTLQLYGIFNLAYSNQNNGLPFYTNLTPLSQVYLEYIPSNFYFTLYVKNQVSYFNSTEVPNNTQPFDEQVNFNLEMLNNGGGYVSYPPSQGVTANYSTKMLPNITRTFI